MTLGVVLLSAGVIGTLLLILVRYEYGWYAKAAVPLERADKLSQDFTSKFSEFYNDITSEQEWYARFFDEQINSYLEVGFIHSGLDTRLLPDGISHPRVVFETDRIHLGFRYGHGAWSTIISIDLKVWVAPNEQNAVALEVEGFHAGALPISAQSLLERIAEVGRQNNIDVTWYRNPDTGNPVAVLRFQADQPRATMLLQAVQLEHGCLTIRGRSNNASQLRTLLAIPGFALKPPIPD